MPMFLDGQDPRDVATAAPQRAPIGTSGPDPFAPAPSLGETVSAAFQLNNPIVSTIGAIANQSPNHAYDPTYNPMSVLKGTRFEEDPGSFVDDPNEATTRARMAQSDREMASARTLAASGWTGTIAGLGAGALDPSYYIPLFGELHAAEAGGSFARSALRAAATGAGQSAISEGVMAGTQENRSWKEAAGGIATNTLLMGVLGGALGSLTSGERAAAVDGLEGIRRQATPSNPLDPASMSLDDHIAPGPTGFSQGVEQRAAELHAAGAAPTPGEAAEAAHIEGLPPEIARAVDAETPRQAKEIPHEMDGGATQDSIADAARRGGSGEQPDPTGALGEQGDGWGQAGRDGGAAVDDATKPDAAAGLGPAAADVAPRDLAEHIEQLRAESASLQNQGREFSEALPARDVDEAGAPIERLGFGEVSGDATKPGANAMAIERAVADMRGPPDGGGMGGAQPAGAAASDQRDLIPKSYGLNTTPGVKKLFNAISPNQRVYSHASLTARRTLADLAEVASRFTMHDRGIATSPQGAIETIVRQAQAKFIAAGHDVLQNAYVHHRYDITKPSAIRRMADAVVDARGQTPDGKLSYKDFKTAVYDAMYSGDQHPVPEVARAAAGLRAKILDPVTKMAQETLGPDGKPMLGEALSPPGGDQSFVPRAWNKEAVTAKRFQLKQIVSNWLGDEQATKARAKDRIQGLQADLEASRARMAEHDAAGATIDQDGARVGSAMEQQTHDGIRKRLEAEIESWKGNSAEEAKALLKARRAAEGDRQVKMDEGSYRGPGDRLKSADAGVDAAVKHILGSDRDLSRLELESRADEIIDRIVGSPDGRIPYDAPSGGPRVGATSTVAQEVRGSLKARDFAIPTDLVKDFVQRDIEHVTTSFLRTMLPDIELTKRFGDVDLVNQMRGIQEDYAKQIGPNTTEAEARSIAAMRNSDIRDIAAVRDRVRGVYGFSAGSRVIPDLARDFRNFTSLASLGTSVANRFNDTGAQAVFRYGLQNVFNDAWRPFFKSMIGMSPLAGIAKQQAAEMGIGMDGLAGHLHHSLSDINESYLPGNKYSRGLSLLNDRSMLINLHGPWTEWMKAMTWVPAQAEFGRIADRIAAGTHTARDLQVMADANIEPAMAVRISQQIQANHEMVDGVRLATAGKWTDIGARDAFERALAREANINVITAGHGDKPLFLSTPLGGMIGQFKGFVAGAHERILISNLQQRDGRSLQGMLVSLAMGMVSYRLYTLLSGQDASPRPQDWVKEGIHRSAMTGWLSEANNTLAKFTAGKLDANRLYGADRPLTRRQDNSPLSELLGPSYARLEGLTGAATHAIGGHATSADVHQLRMALPLQNLMGVRRLIDSAEDGVSANLGMKPRQHTTTVWPP